ncbi:hypothetical protein VPH35_033360 [Triticum aestivum]
MFIYMQLLRSSIIVLTIPSLLSTAICQLTRLYHIPSFSSTSARQVNLNLHRLHFTLQQPARPVQFFATVDLPSADSSSSADQISTNLVATDCSVKQYVQNKEGQ